MSELEKDDKKKINKNELNKLRYIPQADREMLINDKYESDVLNNRKNKKIQSD